MINYCPESVRTVRIGWNIYYGTMRAAYRIIVLSFCQLSSQMASDESSTTKLFSRKFRLGGSFHKGQNLIKNWNGR